jgi:hypothetical protein
MIDLPGLLASRCRPGDIVLLDPKQTGLIGRACDFAQQIITVRPAIWRLFYLCPGPDGYDISFRGRRYRRATYDVSRDEHGIWTAIDRLTGRENYGVTREAAIGALARLEYDLWQAEGRKRLGVRGLLSRWGRR